MFKFKKSQLTVSETTITGYTVQYESSWNLPVEIAVYKSEDGWITVDARSGHQLNKNVTKTRKEICEKTIATLNEVGEESFWQRFINFLARNLSEHISA